MKFPLILAVDFDGTLCEDGCYPDVGEPNQDVVDYVKSWITAGNKVILWTLREGESLKKAIKWCRDLGINFDAINDNLPEVIQTFHENPRKVYADYYLDDHALPCSHLPRVQFPGNECEKS